MMPSFELVLRDRFLSGRAVSSAASLTRFREVGRLREDPAVWLQSSARSTASEIGVAARVDAQDLPRPAAIGAVDGDLPIAAARAQQRGLEGLSGRFSCRDQEMCPSSEPVPLDRLVQRLLALVVTASHPVTAGRPTASSRP